MDPIGSTAALTSREIGEIHARPRGTSIARMQAMPDAPSAKRAVIVCAVLAACSEGSRPEAVPDAGTAPSPDGAAVSAFWPSNVPTGTPLPLAGDLVIDPELDSDCELDTEVPALTCNGAAVPVSTRLLPQAPVTGIVPPSLLVIDAASVDVRGDLWVTGPHALAIVSRGPIVVDGRLVARSGAWPFGSQTVGGPGEGDMPSDTGLYDGAGGGGFCGDGGDGYGAGADGRGGSSYGTLALIPLVGGSSGGLLYPGASGRNAGGGAIQLFSAVQIEITVDGQIDATGRPASGNAAGSGGAILLEAPAIRASSLDARGGDAGIDRPGGGTNASMDGANAAPDVAQAAGAGGAGRIRVNALPGGVWVADNVAPRMGSPCATTGELAAGSISAP